MPTLSDLPGNISRHKLAKALERLGFLISERGGKGSHLKAVHQVSQKCVIIPRDLHKTALYYVLREIESISGYSWEDIKDKL